MADPTSAKYVFLPWVRQGAASGIQTPDSLSDSQAGVITVTVNLQVNDTDPIERHVRLYGPGDVTGIDPQQVVRTEPLHLATDFEPNYFPAIEFDRPDFPWLFTPAKANNSGKLRPWLQVVVVPKQEEGVTLRFDRNLPLPVLEISPPARPERELPDLSESWAWAHGQVSKRDSDSLASALAGDPALTVSRLLCPRRLDPLTQYLACVVPAFDLGCKAGRGLPITPDDEKVLKPAWESGAQSPPSVTLPVYVYWEFRTGSSGDFETLARALVARDLRDVKGLGKRQIDISQPGFKIEQELPPGTTLELEGALRILGASTADWADDIRTRFQTALEPILDAPWQAMKEGKEPLLAPPIYGGWQAARQIVNVAPEEQTWPDELNLDPRGRAVAALGTQVVQTQQEQLMAAAWEQLGEIERVNRIRRQAQFARAVNGVYHDRHFSQFSDETLLNVVAPAQSRVVVAATGDTGTTTMLLSRHISQSALPDRAVSASLRRLTSARGVISRRFRPPGAPPSGLLTKLNTTTIVQLQKKEAGLVTINHVSQMQQNQALGQAIRFEQASSGLQSGRPLSDFKIAAEDDTNTLLGAFTHPNILPGAQDSLDAQVFRRAAQAHLNYLAQKVFTPVTISTAPPIGLSDTKVQLLQKLDPETTIAARVQALLGIVDGAEPPADPLEPILDAPNFPQPMYEGLRDLSQDFLFPGLEHVPPDTVALLETNPKFVESFLVGLNAEMSRELLWRGFPIDQGGTYFRQFWDASADIAQPDIDMINQWGKTALGENAHGGGDLVLLIRGELLRRYPNSVIYAVKAVGNGALSTNPTDEHHPLFRGTLKPDVTFLGFDLKCADVIADPGFFFVIQEQPTEPRFGLDAANFSEPLPLPALTTWDDLSWRYLADTEEALKALSHVSIQPVRPEIDALSQIDKAKWGQNSAYQAYITLQRPVRIAIHASQLISRCDP